MTTTGVLTADAMCTRPVLLEMRRSEVSSNAMSISRLNSPARQKLSLPIDSHIVRASFFSEETPVINIWEFNSRMSIFAALIKSSGGYWRLSSLAPG